MRCGIMNPKSYCSALPQGRVHWITLTDLLCGIINAMIGCSASLQGSVYWITLADLFCGRMNPTLYCSALPQGRVHWITLLNWLCDMMSAKDCIGCAERRRPLKRRLTDWRALECTQEIITALPRGIVSALAHENHLLKQNVVEFLKIIKILQHSNRYRIQSGHKNEALL